MLTVNVDLQAFPSVLLNKINLRHEVVENKEMSLLDGVRYGLWKEVRR